MMCKPVFSVFVDGFFEEIALEEDDCWDIITDATSGVKPQVLDDDMCVRVEICQIDVNKWYQLDTYNCVNKVTGETIMCYNKENTQKCVETLNKISIFQEREEAKERALLL